MPSPNEPLQPTPFDVAEPVSPASPVADTSTASDGNRWILPAMGGLLLLALLVVFWLPGRVNGPPADTPAPLEQAVDSSAQAATNAPLSKPRPAGPEATPWSDAQLARLRKEAQDVLAQLLDIQFALEERGVQQWAPQGFAEAAETAAQGDELYKTREYEAATERYRTGLDTLQALQESVPQVFRDMLEQATRAIEQGDPEAASSALATAALINPDNEELAVLQQRLTVLPQVQTLLTEAAAEEAGGDLAAAQQLLQQATGIDPQHRHASSELQRVAAAARDKGFNAAMSEGYAALDEGRFNEARKSFRAAAKLRDGSQEAASALQEVAAAETAYRLQSLNDKGSRSEQQEQWQQAVDAYEQALNIDASVLFASEGLQRSRARAQLDQQFNKTFAEPGRLSDVAVAEAAENMLQQAKTISPRGNVLAGQIEQLETLLHQANTPIQVTLHSDQQTEVTVYKVARLGRFQQHQLTLRPGTYTAVGTRNGYRDVRRDFTIGHDSNPAPVTIACTEPI